MNITTFNKPEEIFVDANIFVYHLDSQSPFQLPCSDFLRKIETGNLQATTSTLVIDEVIYAILLHTGSKLLDTDRITTIKKRIHSDKSFASSCYELTYVFFDYLEMLRLTGLSILEISFDVIKKSAYIGEQYSLLPRDAIHVSTCKSFGIPNIATRDSHFDRVSFLKVWKP